MKCVMGVIACVAGLAAYEALRNIEQEEDRFHKLLDTIFTLCELSDFHIEERIVIKDKRTGRIWR